MRHRGGTGELLRYYGAIHAGLPRPEGLLFKPIGQVLFFKTGKGRECCA